MASRVSKRVWRTLAILFGIIATILVVITVYLTISSNSTTFVPSMHPSEIKWYHELQPSEIKTVLDFLQEKINISLLSPKNARLNSSFVHYVELKLPIKGSILNYLYQNGPKPTRLAKTAVFRGDLDPPVVEEYILWPLPNIISFIKSRTVPYSQRPLLLLEIASLYEYIVPKFEEATKPFLKTEYGTLLSSCMNQCIDISFTPIPSTIARKGRREIWVWFSLKSVFKLYPLDFQFEVDITNVDPSKWTLGKIWFDARLFDDTNLFVDYYLNEREPKIPWHHRKQSIWNNMNEFPDSKHLPLVNPQSANFQTQRYTITDNFSTVTYLKWKFHFQMSPTGGLRLLNIQYRGKMIVYEMNLQEVAVVYSGRSPAAQNLNFVDGTALFGSRMAGLVEGVDCPFGANFISPITYTVNDEGFSVQHNATCIFEHDPQVPLRRHKISMASRTYYQGIPDKVLVVRVILTFLSYDYIMDYVFHNNGALEARVFSTGSLITTALSPADREFGIRIDPFTLANIHTHFFNYKVDLDVIGVTNRHSIWRIHQIKAKSLSNPNSTKLYTLDKMKQDLINTEKEASYIYDFQKPEYLLFHTGNILNKNGYPRSYRLLLSGLTHKTSDDEIFNSLAWAETQMAVTIRKEYEETSSSPYALWDSINPIVDFRKYINNESIIDEDLIAWITLGFRHIPQMENVPSTMTLGTKSSFLLTPFNYFDEDPSFSDDDHLFFPID